MKWKTINKGDYNYALIPNHPNSTINGYILEHRAIVEEKLRRYLTKDEVVHHINGDKKDNRLENLEVMLIKDHIKLHKKPLVLKTFICPNCQKEFKRRPKGKAEVKNPKCSRKCNGEYSRKIQLNLI